jgi:hypothetical protein
MHFVIKVAIIDYIQMDLNEKINKKFGKSFK